MNTFASNLRRSSAQVLSVLAVGVLLAACGSSVPLDDNKAGVETRTPTTVGNGTGGSSSGTSQSQVASVDLTANRNANQGNLPRVIYFDFDSFVVKEEFRPVVEGHAKLLSNDRSARISVEGHTDERGGREYNLALGQKRAEAVAKSLVLLGARENQLEAVSFGEERPAAQGSGESAWAQNRRVELNRR